MSRSLTVCAAGQNANGILDGRVTDSSGASIAGAKVTVENQSTGTRQQYITSADGRFYQAQVLIGAYRVIVEHPGFQRYVQNGVGGGAYAILYSGSVLQAAGTSGSSGTEGFQANTALNATFDSGKTFISQFPFDNPFRTRLQPPSRNQGRSVQRAQHRYRCRHRRQLFPRLSESGDSAMEWNHPAAD